MENNLFPDGMNAEYEEVVISEEENIEDFKGTYGFDFRTGEFLKNPDGTIIILDKFEAYKQWCEKVLYTTRFAHLSYSDDYGQEYNSLIGEGLSKEAIELEVERMTIEALMVHPFTRSVENFNFIWENNKEELYFSFDVITVLDELFTIEHKEEMG